VKDCTITANLTTALPYPPPVYTSGNSWNLSVDLGTIMSDYLSEKEDAIRLVSILFSSYISQKRIIVIMSFVSTIGFIETP